MAEFVMKALAKQDQLVIESRATSTWEQGNPIHQGTQKILKKYDIDYDGQKSSQQISPHDFEAFDYIIGMDCDNVKDLKKMSAKNQASKIHLFIEGGVPDPWYTGDFEETYRLVTKGCHSWLDQLKDDF